MSIFCAKHASVKYISENFTSCFSKKQIAMFTLVIYASFKDYKINSLDIMAKAIHADYQKVQYLFSDSKWDIQAIKRTRLEIIQNKELLIPQKIAFSPSMTSAARDPLQRGLRVQSGNIADHSKEKRSAISVLEPLSSQT